MFKNDGHLTPDEAWESWRERHLRAHMIKEDTRTELDEHLSGFMEWQITEASSWWEIETNEGLMIVPDDGEDLLDIMNEWRPNFIGCRKVKGFGARLSASGYLDCTEWAVFPTAEEAAQYLLESYAP